MNKWTYTGDISVLDYGGMWIRALDAHRFHIVEITNMNDACGRDNEGQSRYVVELSEVDLREIDYNAVDRCCDVSGCSHGDTIPGIAWAEAAKHYGSAAPLDSVSTNNGWNGIRNMKRRSREIEKDSAIHEELMERPVNKIGSTAREFMRGDIESAIRRGVANGNQDARLMAKCYQACDGRTLGGDIIDLSDLTID